MKLLNKVLNTVSLFKQSLTNQVKIELEINELKRMAKISGMGYASLHVGNTKDGNYPIFIADDFIFVHTKFKDIPQAMAVSLPCGTKEIYVNTAFTKMPEPIRDAAITHEVGHLVLNAIYTPKDKFLALVGMSNKTFLCESAADDYSVASGYDMLGALLYLRDNCGYFGKELNKRIARLSN